MPSYATARYNPTQPLRHIAHAARPTSASQPMGNTAVEHVRGAIRHGFIRYALVREGCEGIGASNIRPIA